MMPATKAMIEYLKDDGRVEEPEGGFTPSDDDGPEDDQTRSYMTVKMKKKRQQLMLKQMLSESGYGDLAKMVNIGKETYEADDND